MTGLSHSSRRRTLHMAAQHPEADEGRDLRRFVYPRRKSRLDPCAAGCWSIPHAQRLTSRQDRKRARWEAEAVLDLGPGDDDERAGRRHFVEVRHHLDMVATFLQ